ncbi:MAG: ketoacyl-ACP synthase III, partial [Ignavibacteriae bacterium]|nr:ketoacyl-ACP synthase III [Ignavibacteriota bacterium]
TDKVIFGATDYGNTVSSSIPILLNDVLLNNNSYEKIVLSGFGVGLSWSSTLLNKIN